MASKSNKYRVSSIFNESLNMLHLVDQTYSTMYKIWIKSLIKNKSEDAHAGILSVGQMAALWYNKGKITNSLGNFECRSNGSIMI